MNPVEIAIRSLDAPMTPPKAYGLFHICLIIGGMSFCILLAWLLRNIDEKKNKIVLLSVASVLILSEIVKQLFLYYVTNNGAVAWGEFPFQMCSMPMYLCPIAVFCKNEKIKRAAYGFMMTFNMLGGLAGVFEPSGVFHSQVFLTVHSITWHYLLVFLGVYIILSGRSGSKMDDYYDVVKLFVMLCFIAFIINTLIGITVGAEANMFFVGPNNSPIIVFSAIAAKFGWVASTLIYVPVTSIAAGGLFGLASLKKRKKA